MLKGFEKPARYNSIRLFLTFFLLQVVACPNVLKCSHWRRALGWMWKVLSPSWRPRMITWTSISSIMFPTLAFWDCSWLRPVHIFCPHRQPECLTGCWGRLCLSHTGLWSSPLNTAERYKSQEKRSLIISRQIFLKEPDDSFSPSQSTFYETILWIFESNLC